MWDMLQQCWTGGYTTQHASQSDGIIPPPQTHPQVFVARMPSVQLTLKPQVSPAVVPGDMKATLILPKDVKVHNLLRTVNLFDFMYMDIFMKDAMSTVLLRGGNW